MSKMSNSSSNADSGSTVPSSTQRADAVINANNNPKESNSKVNAKVDSTVNSTVKMSSDEWRASLSLAAVYAIRMWGLFLLLPVFAIHARTIDDVTALQVGMALGIYGITQALLQVPFGRASDRFGRKPVITAGLLLLATGSVVAAMSTTVIGIIIGRAIQGCGAVAAAVMALTADLTREENRGKAMAIVGISIGVSVMLALMAAPILAARFGVSGIFWLTAALAIIAIFLIWKVVPAEPVASPALPSAPDALRRLITNRYVMLVLVGIALIHALLMTLFVTLPVLLLEKLQLPLAEHWKLYVPILIASAPVLGFVGRSMRDGASSLRMLVMCGVIIALGFLLLALAGTGSWLLVGGVWLFFCGFNGLEAALPSLISRLVPAGTKGVALGVFSTSQFLGVFVGGVIGGGMLASFSSTLVFVVCAVIMATWVVLAWRTGPPVLATSIEFRTEIMSEAEAKALRQQLSGYHGVVDVTVLAASGVAYLSVSDDFDKNSLEHALTARKRTESLGG